MAAMPSAPKLQICSPATGVHRFRRAKLWRRIKAPSPNHIASIGPRRMGETSILRDFWHHRTA